MSTVTLFVDRSTLESQLDAWDNSTQILRNTTRLAYAEELANQIKSSQGIYKAWSFTTIKEVPEKNGPAYLVLGRRDKLKLRQLYPEDATLKPLEPKEIIRITVNVLAQDITSLETYPEWYEVERKSLRIVELQEA